jgi:hypothetical protein
VGSVLALALAGGCGGPTRLPCSTRGPIGTICGFRNPEDLDYAKPAGVLLVSNMRFDRISTDGGFISALDPSIGKPWTVWGREAGAPAAPEPALGEPACTEPPAADAFYPHGLAVATTGGRTLVYVVAHAGKLGGREGVEIFELTGEGEAAKLTWKACIPAGPKVNGNDVAVAPDGEVFMSNYEPDPSLRHMFEASIFGTHTGEIRAWRHGEGWRALEGTAASLPNGVAISHDGAKIFYTETMTGLVYRIPRSLEHGAVSIDVGGNPDNLTWARGGKLLVSTHTGGPAFLLCSFGWLPCHTSWEVYEIDPTTMASSRVLQHDGSIIGAVATALEVDDELYLSSVFDDRIGVVELQR